MEESVEVVRASNVGYHDTEVRVQSPKVGSEPGHVQDSRGKKSSLVDSVNANADSKAGEKSVKEEKVPTRASPPTNSNNYIYEPSLDKSGQLRHRSNESEKPDKSKRSAAKEGEGSTFELTIVPGEVSTSGGPVTAKPAARDVRSGLPVPPVEKLDGEGRMTPCLQTRDSRDALPDLPKQTSGSEGGFGTSERTRTAVKQEARASTTVALQQKSDGVAENLKKSTSQPKQEVKIANAERPSSSITQRDYRNPDKGNMMNTVHGNTPGDLQSYPSPTTSELTQPKQIQPSPASDTKASANKAGSTVTVAIPTRVAPPPPTGQKKSDPETPVSTLGRRKAPEPPKNRSSDPVEASISSETAKDDHFTKSLQHEGLTHGGTTKEEEEEQIYEDLEDGSYIDPSEVNCPLGQGQLPANALYMPLVSKPEESMYTKPPSRVSADPRDSTPVYQPLLRGAEMSNYTKPSLLAQALAAEEDIDTKENYSYIPAAMGNGLKGSSGEDIETKENCPPTFWTCLHLK